MSRFSMIMAFILSVVCLYPPVTALSYELSLTAKSSGTASLNSSVSIKNNVKPIGHVKEVSFFALSKDGRIALTADEDENNYLWDMENGTLLREIGSPQGKRIRVVTAAFSPESSQLLWARNGKTTPVLWDVESGRRIGVLSSKVNGHTASIISMTFSADGRYIATGDTQGTVIIWNRADRSVMRSIKAHSGEARYLAFIKGKNELASAGADGAVRLWGIYGAELLATLLEPTEYAVTALTASVDGRFLYAALENMTVKGWTVSLRRLRGTLDFDDRQINSIALSPDGDLMALAEEDESVLLWNIRESRVVWKNEMESSVTQLMFSPDGKRLFTSGGDNWIREWDVPSGHLLNKIGGVEE